MAGMMGVENMGGPAIGFLAEFPTPTVERGAVMAGMDHSKMPGMRKDTDPLVPIAGRMPRLGEELPGCPYAPRCPLATDLCRIEDPPLRELPGTDRKAACHYAATAHVDDAA